MAKAEQLSLFDFVQKKADKSIADVAHAVTSHAKGTDELAMLLKKAADFREATYPISIFDIVNKNANLDYDNLRPQTDEDVVFLFGNTQGILNDVRHICIGSDVTKGKDLRYVYLHAMANPKAYYCIAIAPDTFPYGDVPGAAKALDAAWNMVKHSRFIVPYCLLFCKSLEADSATNRVAESSEARIWHPATAFTEKEEQTIKTYYLKKLVGMQLLPPQGKNFAKRNRKTDNTLWHLNEAMRHLSHEEIYLLTLDASNRISGTHFLASGTLDSCSTYVSRIASIATNENVHGGLLVHNHPSGGCKSSKGDRSTAKWFAGLMRDMNKVAISMIVAGPACTEFSVRKMNTFIPQPCKASKETQRCISR